MRLIGKKIRRGIDREAEHFGNVLVAVFNFERLRIVARAVAGRARCEYARQEEEFDKHEPFALARLAAAFFYVERKSSGIVAAAARSLRRRKEPAHVIEQAGVSRKVRARRAADGFLVHAHEPFDCLHPAGDFAALRDHHGALQLLAFLVIQRCLVTEMFRDQFHQHLTH